MCFRCTTSLRTRPHMYSHSCSASRVHLHLHVNLTVLLFSIHLRPCRKPLRKSFVIHLFARSTVRCSLLDLIMGYSAAAAPHKSWSSWVWSHNPPPPPLWWRPIVLAFHVETLVGNVYGSQSEGPQNSNFVVTRMWFHITLLNSFVLIFMEPRLCFG